MAGIELPWSQTNRSQRRAAGHAPQPQQRPRVFPVGELASRQQRVAVEVCGVPPHAQVRRVVPQVQVRVPLLVTGSQVAPPDLLQRIPGAVPASDLEEIEEQSARRAVIVVEVRLAAADRQIPVSRRDPHLDRTPGPWGSASPEARGGGRGGRGWAQACPGAHSSPVTATARAKDRAAPFRPARMSFRVQHWMPVSERRGPNLHHAQFFRTPAQAAANPLLKHWLTEHLVHSTKNRR